MSHSFKAHLSICTRRKSKQRPRGVKRFFQLHTESNVGHLHRSQIAPSSSSLKQLTISQFLCIRNRAQPSWVLCLGVSSKGYSQPGLGHHLKLSPGEAPLCQAHLYSCWCNQILKGVGLRTSVSCWLLAGGFPLSFATWTSITCSLRHQD